MMKTPRAIIFITCQGNFTSTAASPAYCIVAQRLLENRISDAIRGRAGATYSVGSMSSVATSEFVRFTVLFSTDSKIANQMKSVAYKEVKSVMEDGVIFDEFSTQKSRLIKRSSDELASNIWWVQSGLYEFYLHDKNIVANHIKIAKDLSLTELNEFTKSIYQQGNIIDIVMKPQ